MLERLGDEEAVERVAMQGRQARQTVAAMLDELAAEVGRVDWDGAAAHSLACHTAVRAGDPLDLVEMAALIEALGQTVDPFSCFHGRPTMIQLRAGDLERWFYRRT